MKYGNVTYFYICYTFSIEPTKFRLKHVQLSSLLHPPLPSPPTATSSHPCLTATATGRGHKQWGRHWGPQHCPWVLSALPVRQQLSNKQARGVVQVRRGLSDLIAAQWALQARLIPPRSAACIAQSWSYLQIPVPFQVCFSLPEQMYPWGLVTHWFLSHTKEEGGFFKERLLKSLIRCWETQT